MAKRKKKKLSMLDAVDRLSNLAELDGQKPRTIEWMDPSSQEETKEKIQETFHAVSDYLHHLYQKDRSELADPLSQRGVRAVMQLAKEAALKVNKYTDLFKGAVEIPAYEELRQFYATKVQHKIKKGPEKELWEHQIREGGLDAEMRALKDLEMVRKDKDYELFYITKHDGTPFWSPHLLKHIRLVGNFDETLLTEDNPLDQIDIVLDRDFHLSAKEIEEDASDLIEQFYKEAMHHKTQPYVASLLRASMALFLAENPKNLAHNTSGKHSLDYFTDFIRYLREAIISEDYQQHSNVPEDSLEPFARTCLHLTRTLCGLLYLRTAAHNDILKLLHHFASHPSESASLLLPSIASYDKALRDKIASLPSGPVLKVLKTFRTGEEHEGFDPHLLHNLPHKLFGLSSDNLDVSFLHLPSPTREVVIDKAAIYPEFAGYLQYLHPQKHLLVNLQDRTSWKEHTRALALEKLSRDNLLVLTLPKDTDFYHQIHDYADLEEAKAFCHQLEEQVSSGESCGFHIPSLLPIPEIITFVHQHLFQSKRSLSQKERCDFIELFYQFLILFMIDKEKPTAVSFTCKDGIDTGAAFSASLYGLLRLLSSKEAWTENDRDFFLFSLYGPALLLRHRIIDAHRLHRALSALSHLEEAITGSRASILKACSELLPDLPLQNIKLREVA